MLEQINHAIQIHRYGGPEELKFERVEHLVPHVGEVLVRVYAAGVNPIDWKITQGYLKDFMPVSFPYIPGRDLAGVVEEVGPGVTTFHKGQAVYGQGTQGTYAEYAIASINKIALKPETINFDEAAAIPVGATTAWQGLFDHGGLQAGQRVLIQGGAGGVGLFAVQFARWKGAYVISTASTANVDFVRSLGANEVIDYTKASAANAVHNADLVFDTVGGKTLEESCSLVKYGGTLITIAGQPSEAKVKELDIHVVRFSANVTTELLDTFNQLIDEGQIKVVVGKIFPLSEASQSHELSRSGHGRGRIVLHAAD